MAKRTLSGKRLSSQKRHKGNVANFKKWYNRKATSVVDTAEGKPISEQKTNFGPTTSLTANDDLIIPPRTSPRSILDEVTVASSNTTAEPSPFANHDLAPVFEVVQGNRIFDVTYLFHQLRQISSHGARFGCTFDNLVITKEIRSGLLSKIIIKCQMCNDLFYLNSQKPKEEERKDLDLNALAVKGIMSIGSGYSNLEEFLGSIDIPCMAETTYQNRHEVVANAWQQVANDAMMNAAKEEHEHAKEIGSVDKNGVPLVEVVVDGAWSKRSYKTKYNALSGVAAIVGQYTGKVLYIGVKNKFCVHCSRGKSHLETKPHICSKNYSGSSTAMESEILVQGFKLSTSMYGIKYHRVIGDGDSSTYNKIVESRPYPDITVEKVECRNHLLRNYSGKLKELSSNTSYSRKERKLLEARLLRLRAGVKYAIKEHKQKDDKNMAISCLRHDILNGVNHVFGDHQLCGDYFCSRTDEENLKQTLSDAFLSKILEIVRRLANHSRSLLVDVDSNIVEHYNAKVAKFIGGKRVNFALKNSYESRCRAAVVSHNTNLVHTYFKNVLLPNSAHGKIIRRIEMRRLRKLALRKASKRNRFRKTEDKGVEDKDYGEQCQKPDMDPTTFEHAKQEFLISLQKSDVEIKLLEEETKFQSQCGRWLEERRKLVTASNFAKICKRRKNSDSSKLVKDMLYKSQHLYKVPSIRHGYDHEEEVKRAVETKLNITIDNCGLFVDRTHCYLGASPDGTVDDNMVVEIKCPYTAFKLKMSVDEAILAKKILFWKKTEDGVSINKQHDWYYQIQGQLHVTGRRMCLVCVWTGYGDIKLEYIERDDHFWAEKMESKLKHFYFKCLVPELVDPRQLRNLPLRSIFL